MTGVTEFTGFVPPPHRRSWLVRAMRRLVWGRTL
jgi:hypothetical protein